MTARPRRRRTFVVLAVAGACVLTAVLGEVAVRLLLPSDAVFARVDRWEPHERLGRVLRADQEFTAKGVQYRVNAKHLRDHDYAPEPPEGTYRIAIVGDSYVYGIGPLETIFPKLLEVDLMEAFDGRVEVMAIGMPGYGTGQQNAFLEQYLDDHRFHLVIHAFCVGNDITENRRWMHWEESPGRSRTARFESSALRRLADRSRLAATLRKAVQSARGAGKAKYYRFVNTRMRLAYEKTYDEEVWRLSYARTLAEVLRMRAFAAAHGADFAVCLLPSEYQLDEGLRSRVHEIYDSNEEGLVPRLVQRKLMTDLPPEGVSVIDLFAKFADGFEPGTRFIPFDTHFDEEGNRITADALLAWVTATHRAEIARVTAPR